VPPHKVLDFGRDNFDGEGASHDGYAVRNDFLLIRNLPFPFFFRRVKFSSWNIVKPEGEQWNKKSKEELNHDD